MSKLYPYNHLIVRHNYSGDKWQDFAGDLTELSIVLRALPGSHTLKASFYNPLMDPSQSSGTRVVKKGDKIRIWTENGDGTFRRVATMKVTKAPVVDIDLTAPAGRRNKVTIEARGNGVLGVAGIGGSSGVDDAEELSNIITGAEFEINGDPNTYAWSGTKGASTSTETTPAAVVRTNLCPNPSFEYDTTGITSVNAVSSREGEWSADGAYALKVISSGVSSDSFARFSGIELTPGQTYTVSATVRVDTPLTGALNGNALRIKLFNGDFTQSFQSSQAVNAAGETRVSVTFTPAAGDSTYEVRLYNGSPTLGESVWWDEVLIEKTNTLKDYFDGDSAGYSSSVKAPTGVFTEVSAIDTASELEQIALTLDSNPSLIAYEDPAGKLQIFDRDNFRTGGAALTVTADNYSSIDMSFDTSHIVNVLAIKYLEKIKAGNKSTRVKEHNIVYKDDASVSKYGPFKKTRKVHKKSNFAAYASDLFARNADPEEVPLSVQIPIINAADLLPGYEDGVYTTQKVAVYLPDGVTFYTCRISRIVHTISADKWIVTLFLRDQNIHHASNPNRIARTEIANNPDGTVLTAHLDDESVTSTKLADGAVTAAKTDFTVNDIGGHKFTVSPTAPVDPGTGDFWVDSDNGNVLMTYNGASWVSIQDAAIAEAQTTADGKNTVRYSTVGPGATPNAAGDVWFQTSGTTIIGQWRGNGGTSWTAVTLTNSVISTLDAGKITTGSLAAARIAANTITAAMIAANAITAAKIAAGAIDGMTITGPVIQTATSGSRLRIEDDTAGGVIKFYAGSLGETPGFINPAIGGTGKPQLIISTSSVSVANPIPATITLQGSNTLASVSGTCNGNWNVGGTMVVDGAATFDGGVTINNGITAPGLTTGGAVNVNVSSGGVIREVTSSKRFKENIKPFEVDVETSLKLKPSIYQRKDRIEGDPEWEVGFIAEDAEELGLTPWVTRNLEGEVQSFDYAKWTIALQAQNQKQQALIEKLEQRIEQLEKRLDNGR